MKKQILKSFTLVLIGTFVFFIGNRGCLAQKRLPEADLFLLDGSVLKHNSLENKIVIINLWGTWCAPCLAEIPELNKLEKEFAKNEQVIFLALAKDEPEKLKKFLSRREFRFRQLDINKSNAKHFNTALLKMYPKTLVYNKEGNLTQKFLGQLDSENLSEIREFIQEQIE